MSVSGEVYSAVFKSEDQSEKPTFFVNGKKVGMGREVWVYLSSGKVTSVGAECCKGNDVKRCSLQGSVIFQKVREAKDSSTIFKCIEIFLSRNPLTGSCDLSSSLRFTRQPEIDLQERPKSASRSASLVAN